jgi:hypothetical protein
LIGQVANPQRSFVLPIGQTNATETFQNMMNTVLKGLTGKSGEVYLDDIQHVKMVVERLRLHA